MSAVTALESARLAAADRCDRCGARAVKRVDIVTADLTRVLPLLFCQHHFNEHATEIYALSNTIGITDL